MHAKRACKWSCNMIGSVLGVCEDGVIGEVGVSAVA